jgi:hypothetical protein
VEGFNGLVAMGHADVAFPDNAAELRSKAQIYREASMQANEVYARVTKVLLKVAASGSHESQFESVCCGIATEIKLHGLSAATVQGIEYVQDFDHADRQQTMDLPTKTLPSVSGQRASMLSE